MSKREQNKQINRTAILGAGKKIFSVKSIETCNVTEIIAKSGLAAGTFYKYFDSKTAIFDEISNSIAKDIAGIIDNCWLSEREPNAYIKSVVYGIDSYFHNDPAALGFMLRNYNVLSDSYSSNNAWRLVTGKLVEHMTLARDFGLLRCPNPELMIKTLMASTTAVLSYIEGDCQTLSDKRDALEFIKSFLINSVLMSDG